MALLLLLSLTSTSLLAGDRIELNPQGQLDWKFTQHPNGSVDVIVTNQYDAIGSFWLTVSGKNWRSDKPLPSMFILEKNERRKVFSLFPQGNPKEITPVMQGTLGNVNARNDFVYRLPFRSNVNAVVIQSFGDHSHSTHYDATDPTSEYAIDFSAKLNTPVVAARAGKVVYAKFDSHKQCTNISCVKDANVVHLMHSDGTSAVYAHLMPGMEVVKKGQEVRAGQIVGFVGNTGYSFGPHLHFAVYKPHFNGQTFSEINLRVLFTDGKNAVNAVTGKTVRYLLND